jgi:proline dehydrogenase
MEDAGKPVIRDLEALTKMAKQVVVGGAEALQLDFSNTEIAFADRSEKELKKMARLFGLMNKHWLVGIGSKLGLAAIRMHLPFVESAVKYTIFEQFCGGTTLLETQKTIERLSSSNIKTILDYGAEAKESEEEMNFTMNENIRGIDFAAHGKSVPIVSTKITGLARFELLESIQAGETLTPESKAEYKNVLRRLDALCNVASQKGVSIFFDAEETWIQNTIDHLVEMMMKRYNKTRAVIYTTCQMYRTDRLQYLFDLAKRAEEEHYVLGVKLVRGAYMEKERHRAEEMGYPSPIHPTKDATDDAYNTALRFCIDNYETIASCNASHNADSAMLQAKLIVERSIPRQHPHLMFCQLYGMSDNLTFNLANAGFNSAKYVPYGSVREVIPFLIRRAQENSTVTGDMSREYQLVYTELKRRGLA